MALFTNYNDEISKLISQKPTYDINSEYTQNQQIARNKAYGRNRAFQTEETNIDQAAADATNQAQQYSSSTSSILNTLSSITGQKIGALRGLGQDESMYQAQALGDLQNANTAQAEEKDKAWNYNVNEPYQLKMNQLVQQKKARNELFGKILDTVGTIGTLGASKLLGFGSKSQSDTGGI